MKIPAPYVRKKARIEIIPLIDIIFFLLATFVMVSLSMVKMQGIKVNLPTASTSSSMEDPKLSVTVTVARDGSFYLNRVKMGRPALIAEVNEIHRATPQTVIVINGDREAAFGDAVGLLDEIRRLGIVKVTIQTKSASEAGTNGNGS